jgi:hypothetical protein
MNTPKKGHIAGAFLLTAALGATMLPMAGPALAGKQSNKNTMRNLAIGAGALGVYGLAKHNTTLGVLGLAGGAYAASRYEKDRHQQSVNNHKRSKYYHRQTEHNRSVGNYTKGNRRYYLYDGHQYYMNLSTGARHRAK